jgi:hypothetical protein
MSVEPKKPEFEFPDASRVYNQRTSVGGLMIYTSMTKVPVEGPDGSRHWCQTLVVDPATKPVTPIISMTHASMLEAVGTHGALVTALRAFEKIVRAPLALELEALKTALKASEEDLLKANKALEAAKLDKKEAAKKTKK